MTASSSTLTDDFAQGFAAGLHLHSATRTLLAV